MRIIVSGMLSDHQGRIFLQQSGPRALVPVHRGLEIGTPATETLARAFREETSLFVLPVRLAGIHYDGKTESGELSFTFRCTMRGGHLDIPEDQPAAGFFDCPPLPRAVAARFQRQLENAVYHAGGPPTLQEGRIGLGARLGRLTGRGEKETASEAWEVYVRTEADAGDDFVEWVITEFELTQATAADPRRPPWATAQQLLDNSPSGLSAAVRLSRVELSPSHPAIALVFAPLPNQ